MTRLLWPIHGEEQLIDWRGGFQIDHEVKVDRLFEGKISGLRAFQDLVHIESGAAD